MSGHSRATDCDSDAESCPEDDGPTAPPPPAPGPGQPVAPGDPQPPPETATDETIDFFDVWKKEAEKFQKVPFGPGK